MNQMRLTVLSKFIPKIKKEYQRNLTNTCACEIIFSKKYTIYKITPTQRMHKIKLIP